MPRLPLGLKTPKCKAHSTRTGKPCRRWAIHGGTVCPTHGGSSGHVKKAAAQRVKDMLAEAVDPKRVLREAGRLAYSDIRRLFNEDGSLLPMRDWPDDIAHAVASVEFTRGNVDKRDGKLDDVVKVRLWDKPSKITDLMKHHGQLTDKLEISGNADLLARLDAGRRRAAEKRK